MKAAAPALAGDRPRTRPASPRSPICRHHAFDTGRFDLGNMTQAVWATAHGHSLQVTNLAGQQIVAPRRARRPDPRRVRAALVALAEPGAAARRPGGRGRARRAARCSGSRASTWARERAALGFALAYLLYPPTQWLTLNEFHPVALALPAAARAFWFLDEDRLVPFAVCAVAGRGRARRRSGSSSRLLGLWYAVSRAAAARGGRDRRRRRSPRRRSPSRSSMPHFSPAGRRSFYARYRAVGGTPGGIAEDARSPTRCACSARASRATRPPLPRALLAAARLALRPRAARCARRAARGRAERPLGDARRRASIELPLHGRAAPAAPRRERLRRRAARRRGDARAGARRATVVVLCAAARTSSSAPLPICVGPTRSALQTNETT